MFRVGQKVVCTHDNFKWVSNDQLIREGEVYTIRWVGRFTHYIDGDFLGLRFEEIVRGEDPAGYTDPDMPYRASRFRPVVEPAPDEERKALEDA